MKDLQIAVPSRVPAVAMLRSLADQLETMQPGNVHTPRIGAPWEGQLGVYAGMARGLKGVNDYPLIVQTGDAPEMMWKDALQHASTAGDGQWRVPTRRELALCYANVPELFAKEWHWTCEHYEPATDYAWAQHFVDGNQFFYLKGLEFRVRLVRSVILLP